MDVNLLDTLVKPTLLLDEGRARRNIAGMAEKARRQGVRFRPHFKTHQSAEIGEWFRAQGVSQITVSSVDMALYFAAAGWQDITLAFPVNLRQVNVLSSLARQVRLGLLVESPESAAYLVDHLAGEAAIWLKVDVGYHRTGLPWDSPEAAQAVLSALAGAPHLRPAGLLTHAGHTYQTASTGAVRQIYHDALARLQKLRQALGRPDLEISVGDTPACSLIEDFSGVDEIRPGNFIFYDAEQYLLGSCAAEQVAVAVACPVVAVHAERQEVVVYGGAVHLSKDCMPYEGRLVYGLVALPEGDGWGSFIPGAYVSALSQEHGVLHMPTVALERIHIGGLLCVIPFHSCLAVAALGRYLTLDGRTISTMNNA